MKWLPDPGDFRQRLQAAAAARTPAEQVEQLAELSQSRLSFMQTIQIDNALKGIDKNGAPEFAPVRLAILSSSTVEHLPPAIRVAGLRRRMLIDVHTGVYGQYRQDLFDPTSALQKWNPQIVLLALTCRETLAAIPLSAAAAEVRRALAAAVEDLRALWSKAQQRFGATVIQQSFLDVSEPLFGSFDRLVPGSPSRIVAGLNNAMSEVAAENRVLVLDIARYSARHGLEAWFDIARWLQGKIEIAPAAAPLYGELLARLIGAQRGISKKCLVLDLDNTLWGGVIGDVGLENIVLGEGSAAGEAHLALQQYAKALQERGIILAVCSKNETAIVETAFREHPEMVLKQADISAFMVNWTDKAENIKTIAAQLNIGLDSLVFVDDNPAERARVRAALPMVAVPELPEDPALYVRCLADAGYFEAVSFTEEDRERAGQYAANLQRESLRETVQSMDDFLRGLDMTVVYGPVTSVDLARATQLINKTNQFNTTTRRFNAGEMAQLAGDATNLLLQFRLLDRFGDNGLVSVMILCPEGDPAVLRIASWVMSCRVFGRQLEEEAMNLAIEAAQARGARLLQADIIATKKNAVIADLYSKLGFAAVSSASPAVAADTTHWRIAVGEYTARKTFINRKAQT